MGPPEPPGAIALALGWIARWTDDADLAALAHALEPAATLATVRAVEGPRGSVAALLGDRPWPPRGAHAADLDLGLAHGLSGLGYALLRLADPALPPLTQAPPA